MSFDPSDPPVALVTGAAQRIGATIARTLHGAGYRVALHYRHSQHAATALAETLNGLRPDSAAPFHADLLDPAAPAALVAAAAARWGRLDALVNNASTFYPTRVGEVGLEQWEESMVSNLRAPFFLCQAARPWLEAAGGAIVNVVDIHGERPMKGYPVYSIAKAGKAMLTKALARELAPRVRVNAVAPGAILWPEREMGEGEREAILGRIPLARKGEPEDIARTVRFLLSGDARYVTGQILAVDGGRSLNL